MAVRNSEYARITGDTYVTPRWVYDALYEVEPWAKKAWDCAPAGAQFDFLSYDLFTGDIATNPPFSLAEDFVRHALALGANRIAMLLPYAFDAAKTRRDLFAVPFAPFKARYNITRRIRWENLEQKKAGPSQNHAWFVWDQHYEGTPKIGWLPVWEGV